MRARLVDRRRVEFPDGSVAEYVIWEVPEPVRGSEHRYKYRFYFGPPGKRLIGYDNERGKGDHRHIDGREEAYSFRGLDQLVDDFWDEVARRSSARPKDDDSN
jgi:hypothetical protein